MPKSGKCIDGCPKFPKNTSKKSGMSLDFDKLRRKKRMTPSGDMDTPTKTPPAPEPEKKMVQVGFGGGGDFVDFGSYKEGSPELAEALRKREAHKEMVSKAQK